MFFHAATTTFETPCSWGVLRKEDGSSGSSFANSVAGGRKIQTGTKIISFHLLPYAHCF